MRPGDIVRRKLPSGIPIGAHYIVTKINKNGVFGTYYDSNDERFIAADDTHLKVCNHMYVQVSKEDIDKLAESKPVSFSHTVNPTWDKLMNQKPEIVILYAKEDSRRILCFGLEFKRVVKRKEIDVCLIEGEKKRKHNTLQIKMYIEWIHVRQK